MTGDFGATVGGLVTGEVLLVVVRMGMEVVRGGGGAEVAVGCG